MLRIILQAIQENVTYSLYNYAHVGLLSIAFRLKYIAQYRYVWFHIKLCFYLR